MLLSFFGKVAFNAADSVNYLLNITEQAVAGGPFRSRINTFDTPVRWHGRGNVSVFYQGASMGLFGNYSGAYTNDQAIDSLGTPITPQKVSSYLTFDLNRGYETSFQNRQVGILKGLRGAFTILNLFDRLPPVSISANSGGSNSGTYNPATGLPFGRRFSFQLTGSSEDGDRLRGVPAVIAGCGGHIAQQNMLATGREPLGGFAVRHVWRLPSSFST